MSDVTRGRPEVYVNWPCPDCGRRKAIQVVMFTSPDGKHQHTWYVCTNWPKPLGGSGRCGWTGWSVPKPEPTWENLVEAFQEAGREVWQYADDIELPPLNPGHVAGLKAVLDLAGVEYEAPQVLGTCEIPSPEYDLPQPYTQKTSTCE